MTDLQSRIAALAPEQRALLEARVADLTAARASARSDGIRPRDRSQPTPLSYAQQREWALARFRPSNNISGAIRLEGNVDLDLLGRVLTEVTARHEVLRSTVEMVDRTPVQVVHPVTPIPVTVVDLSHLPAEQQRVEVRERGDAEVMRPFPPEQVQMMRATALRLRPDAYVVLLTIHHAASDGWSMALVLSELAELYPVLRGGRASSLPPLPIQYGDFAVWERERLGQQGMAAELAHWKRVLDGIPPRLELPTDRPYPARRTFDGDIHAEALDREPTEVLQRFAEREGVSISMIMLAACSVVLHRYTGQDDLVFGSAVTGRVRPETERLIGCFANALPLRMRLSRTETLHQVLRRARDVVADAFDHQDIPFDRLIEELGPRESSATPLIQMMINVMTAPGGLLLAIDRRLEMPDLRVIPEPMAPGPVPIDLILVVFAQDDTLHFEWHYSTELFEVDTIARLARQVRHTLDQLVNKPEVRIGDVEMLDTTPAGRPRPRTRAGAGEDATFVELFRRQVALAPDAPAVVCAGVETTYQELNDAADRLARHLRGLGVGPESAVGILLEPSAQLPVAILGVLKAGGAYLALDPQYPPDRVGFLLSDARTPVLITTKGLAPLAAGGSPTHTVLLGDADPLPIGADDPTGCPEPASAAYVVYTSGSTGQPKGVVIEHRSLVTFAREVAERLQLGAGDRFLQFASPGFDVLAEELFPIWLAGGAVVIPPPAAVGPGLDLTELIEKERLTVIELPAAYWHEWVRQIDRVGRQLPASLRLVIVGAERVLPERIAMWQRLGVPLMHVYGISETTVSSTFFRLPRNAPAADLRHLPIGTALPSADLQVLDTDLRPVPVGALGELYIGGIGVGRGYLARPGLTAQRFVANPDPSHPGERVYRTGDLVRQRSDGNLEFHSRVDTQIKIRGLRVEPAEIESAVCRHPQVAQAVVAVHEPNPGDRRLVAYLVPQARTRPNITDLRRFLGRELPPYLVPSAFVQLDALPLTENGKVDHDRLPAPGDERPELVEELVLPTTPLEQQLADVVAAVLGVTLVGANDNFFELGGDSILAIQVVARAQELGITLSPLDLFEHPTIALLAQAAAAGKTGAGEDSAAPGGEPVAETAAGADPTADVALAGGPPAPSDFPLARVGQDELDTLLGRLTTD
jgi:amino acid adenylation domain-containing protein